MAGSAELELPLANWRCRNCGAADRTRDCECRNDPRHYAAHRDPEAFIAGYLEGWSQALHFSCLTGQLFVPGPFLQASPAWIAGQQLRESITPMVLRETPWADDRFFGEGDFESLEEEATCLSCGDELGPAPCPSCGCSDCNYCTECCAAEGQDD